MPLYDWTIQCITAASDRYARGDYIRGWRWGGLHSNDGARVCCAQKQHQVRVGGGWGIGAQSLNCVLEVRCSLFCSALWSVLSDGLNNYCIDLKCEQFCCAAELLTEDMRGKRKLPRIFVLCIISWQVSFNFIALSPRIGLCVLHKRGTLLFLQICKHVYLVNSILFLYIT